MNDLKSVLAETGYIGVSPSVLLAQHNCVIVADIVSEKA